MEKEIQFYEVAFGKKADENTDCEDVCNGLYDTEYGVAIKATHYPTIEEVEAFVKEDLEIYGADGVYSVTPITEDEVYSFYDTERIGEWKVLGA